MYENYQNQNQNQMDQGRNLDQARPEGGIYSGASGSVNGMNGGMQENGTYRYSSRYPNNFTTPQMNGAIRDDKKQHSEQKKMSSFKKILLSAGMGVCFGVCAGLSFFAVEKLTGLGTKTAVSTETKGLIEEKTDDGTAADIVTNSTIEESQVATTKTVTNTIVSDVSEVVKNVMPSVVSIVNNFTESYSYFGQNFSQESQASGSGIIVGMNDTELLIVTNYHVVEDANTLKISFVDDSVAEAQVKGTRPTKDLAVIAVPLENLSSETLNSIAVAKLGDSDELTVGEPAIAI